MIWTNAEFGRPWCLAKHGCRGSDAGMSFKSLFFLKTLCLGCRNRHIIALVGGCCRVAASTKTQRNLPFSHELAGSVSSNRSERGREGEHRARCE